GDAETGVCLMHMDEGMDTGPVIACAKTPIDPDETADELGQRLAHMGAALVRQKLAAWVEGELTAEPQDEARVTLAPILKKEDGRIDWCAPARAVHDRVRGMTPWPGAFFERESTRVKMHRTRVRIDDDHTLAEPGTILRADAKVGIEVACGRGTIAI